MGVSFLFIFAATVWRTSRDALQLAMFTVIAAFMSLLNPWGLDYWRFIFDALALSRPRINEWDAVPLFSPIGVMIVVCTLLILLGRDKRGYVSRDEIWRLSFLGFSLCIAFTHLRLVAAYFTVVAAFFSPELAAGTFRLLAVTGKWRAIIADVFRWMFQGGLALAVCCLLFQVVAVKPSLNYDAFPVEAMDWLWKNGYGGRLMIGFNEGSFGLWRGYPRVLVSLDGRYEEVYQQEVVEKMRCAILPDCAGGEAAFRAVNPELALVRASKSPQWISSRYDVLYRDESFELYGAPGLQKKFPEAANRPLWEPSF